MRGVDAEDGELYFRQLKLGPMMNYIYLVGPADRQVCAAIDPGWNVPAILGRAQADERKIELILLTHTHPDHINGVKDLVEATGASVHVHRAEIGAIESLAEDVVKMDDGEVFEAGGLELTALHTPGHSPGSQVFRVGRLLLTGDTLFVGSMGRVDLPGSDPEAMFDSLQRLKRLEGALLVYPGHDYGPHPCASLADECRSNPYLQPGDRETFLQLIGYA